MNRVLLRICFNFRVSPLHFEFGKRKILHLFCWLVFQLTFLGSNLCMKTWINAPHDKQHTRCVCRAQLCCEGHRRSNTTYKLTSNFRSQRILFKKLCLCCCRQHRNNPSLVPLAIFACLGMIPTAGRHSAAIGAWPPRRCGKKRDYGCVCSCVCVFKNTD